MVLFQSHIGVKGLVKNTEGKAVSGAEVKTYNMSTGKEIYIPHDIISSKLFMLLLFITFYIYIMVHCEENFDHIS